MIRLISLLAIFFAASQALAATTIPPPYSNPRYISAGRPLTVLDTQAQDQCRAEMWEKYHSAINKSARSSSDMFNDLVDGCWAEKELARERLPEK